MHPIRTRHIIKCFNRRVAQWQSISVTSRGSVVQSHSRLPKTIGYYSASISTQIVSSSSRIRFAHPLVFITNFAKFYFPDTTAKRERDPLIPFFLTFEGIPQLFKTCLVGLENIATLLKLGNPASSMEIAGFLEFK